MIDRYDDVFTHAVPLLNWSQFSRALFEFVTTRSVTARSRGNASKPKWRSSGTSSVLLLALFLLFSADAVVAQEDADTATTQLADGHVLVGPLRSLSAGEIRLGDGGAPLSVADVVRIDFQGRRREAMPRASMIQLINGDRVLAGLTSMSDEAVVALWKSHPDWPPVRIPSETIAGILMTAPTDARARSRAFAQVFGRRPKSDVVLLLNGDRAAGDLQTFDQTHLKLAQAGKPLQIELARVRGIAFNSTLSSLPSGKKPRIQITLTDGSQLSGYAASRERGGPLRFTTAFGSPLEIPLPAISTIRFLDGRTTYLSDLEPAQARSVEFFGSSQRVSLAKDRNVLGGPLRLRGVEYPRGIGTRSQSRIVFDLTGDYHRFHAVAGIDDLAEEKGSVRFIVERDGARIFESEPITGAHTALTVGPLDITGAHQLALIVDYGELADINDWADWCDAVVIR